MLVKKRPKAGRELMPGRAFRWGCALPQRRREKKHRGKRGKKTKQVNNRCDRMHWKMWKRAKREKCKWLCGRAADEWRWGGTTVFCSNQNDLLRGCGGGNMETSHFKYVSRLGDIHEWNSSLNSTRDQNITHWLIFNFKKKEKKGFTGTFTAVLLPSTSGLEKGDSPWWQCTKKNLFF